MPCLERLALVRHNHHPGAECFQFPQRFAQCAAVRSGQFAELIRFRLQRPARLFGCFHVVGLVLAQRLVLRFEAVVVRGENNELIIQ
ncbi:hypothetical protein D9M70_576460 [compost metagenome]